MIDLQSKRWIVAKGIAFLGIAGIAATLMLFKIPIRANCRIVGSLGVGSVPVLLLPVLRPGALC